jgi:hypothetical protein
METLKGNTMNEQKVFRAGSLEVPYTVNDEKTVSTSDSSVQELVKYLRQSGLMPALCKRFVLTMDVEDAMTVSIVRCVTRSEVELLVDEIGK